MKFDYKHTTHLELGHEDITNKDWKRCINDALLSSLRNLILNLKMKTSEGGVGVCPWLTTL
jgi:hypothetical protein